MVQNNHLMCKIAQQLMALHPKAYFLSILGANMIKSAKPGTVA